MAKKELVEEVAADKAAVGKSISVIDVLVAVFGILGFACLGAGAIEKGIKGNNTSVLVVGIVLSVFAVLWIFALALICANRKKKNPGLLWHLCIILLDVSILFYLIYGRVENSFEVSTFNLSVCIISVAFSFISLFLYFLRSPKIGIQYASYILMLFAAVFAVINCYTLHLVPYLSSLRSLEDDASFLERFFAITLVVGAVLIMIHTILLVAALAGGLVDRGSKIGLYAEELKEEESIEIKEEIPEAPKTKGVIIIKKKKEEEQ